MQYPIRQIAEITAGAFLNEHIEEATVEHLLLDSRQVIFPASSLFIALQGRRFDGHQFLQELYNSGIRHFLVSQKTDVKPFPSANFILVKNTHEALHRLATWHRHRFHLPVIGITGSNGKTIVKEWLFQLLHQDYHIVRSPKSYNSQTGVPLSVLQTTPRHTLGIFEAGISQMGEMEKLAPVLDPGIGIFTTLGEAHSEGFPDKATKLREKLKLFRNAQTLIYCCDDEMVERGIGNWKLEIGNSAQLVKWSAKGKPANFKVKKITRSATSTTIELQSSYLGGRQAITIPFTDGAAIENAIHCWVLMLHLGHGHQAISERMEKLEPVALRLELKAGINGCTIINDSYNSDLTSLTIALDFLVQQSNTPRRTLILSDILQSGQTGEQLYSAVAKLVLAKKINRLVGIGEDVSILGQLLPDDFNKKFYESTDSFLGNVHPETFHNETILLKGARQFGFEKIADRLSRKVHQTVLEVNLTALLNNLRVYQSHLRPGTKLMVMVKASAYGSGSTEIAKLLEFQHVDYLAVAYTDEGVELRKAGIQLPILVLNPEEATFDSLIRYQLEPEVYSFQLLEKFVRFVKTNPPANKIPIHIKLDTGMNRLGFHEENMEQLLEILIANHQSLTTQSILSHLAASDDQNHDGFTDQQIARFQKMYATLAAGLGHRPTRHILNSGGIVRFPEHQMEMVRLGIGLYGIDGSGKVQDKLQTVNTLKATVSQIKNIPAGQTIGYARQGVAKQPMKIATFSIGYADGLLRKTGNGNFSVLINGKRASLIGNVCMDMAMADVTHIPDVREGGEAIVFGKDMDGNELPVQELADCLGTIPYEIFTSISERVKRVYVQE